MKYLFLLTGLVAFSLQSTSFAASLCDRTAYGKVLLVGIGTEDGSSGKKNVNDGHFTLMLEGLSREDKDKSQGVAFYLDPRKANEKEILDLVKLAFLTDKVLAVGGQIESKDCSGNRHIISSDVATFKSVHSAVLYKD